MEITGKLFNVLVYIFGILALTVKIFPTVPEEYPWLVTIIKIIGKITNRQTDDDAVRQAQK